MRKLFPGFEPPFPPPPYKEPFISDIYVVVNDDGRGLRFRLHLPSMNGLGLTTVDNCMAWRQQFEGLKILGPRYRIHYASKVVGSSPVTLDPAIVDQLRPKFEAAFGDLIETANVIGRGLDPEEWAENIRPTEVDLLTAA